MITKYLKKHKSIIKNNFNLFKKIRNWFFSNIYIQNYMQKKSDLEPSDSKIKFEASKIFCVPHLFVTLYGPKARKKC